MPKINFNQARKILEEISPKDNIAIIHHDDGDGFCSGIIYYEWCKQQGSKVEEFTYTINKTKLKDFDLSPFNKLIITDIASSFMTEELIPYSDKQILFLDHHPKEGEFDKNVSYYITKEMGYIPASRTAGELTKLKPLLSLTGTITDMGQLYPENDEFIEEKLKKFGTNIDFFQEHVSNVISNTICYLSKDHKKTFEIIKNISTLNEINLLKPYSDKVSNEITKIVESYESNKENFGSINFYFFEPKFPVKGIVISIISNENPKEIYVFANPSSSIKGQILISARNQSREKDVSVILKKAIIGIENANAGGHSSAAGAGIPTKDLEKFKENLRNIVQK